MSGFPVASLVTSVSASVTKPVSLHSGHGFFSYSTGCSLVIKPQIMRTRVKIRQAGQKFLFAYTSNADRPMLRELVLLRLKSWLQAETLKGPREAVDFVIYRECDRARQNHPQVQALVERRGGRSFL
jgi:hypothetical protein